MKYTPLEKSLINIKHLFTVADDKLENIKYCFTENKFNLNVEKRKYSFFNKPSKKDDISPCLPKLIINNHEIQREKSIKLLGVLLDEHLTRKEHMKCTGNIIAKIHRYMQNHGGDALIEHI